MQEAYFRTSAHGKASGPLRPYLFSLARNLASKARRHDRVVDALSVQDLGVMELQATCESPEEAALADERLRLLNDAIASLPPQCRAAFTLRMFQARDYAQPPNPLNRLLIQYSLLRLYGICLLRHLYKQEPARMK